MVPIATFLIVLLAVLVGTVASSATADASRSSSAGASRSSSSSTSTNPPVNFVQKNQQRFGDDDDDDSHRNLEHLSVEGSEENIAAGSSSSSLLSSSRLQQPNNHPPTPPHHHHHQPRPDVDWDSFGFSLNGVQTNAMWVDKVDVVFEEEDEAEKSNGSRVQDDDGDGGSDIDGAGCGTDDSNKMFFGLRPPKGSYSCDEDDCLVDLTTTSISSDEKTTTRMVLSLSPAATCLNYGQALFEGIKAFRRSDGTTIGIFRPEMNAKRMQDGASRFLLPPVPTDIFLKALTATVRANAEWVPPYGRGALYVRPILIGTGAGLGVGPSSEATFCIYASPVGNYFKGTLKCIRLLAVKGFARAAPNGGVGSIKASGNYAPAFLAQRWVRQVKGFDEILCLDASTNEAVEEAGASNIFAYYRHNNTLVTPCTSPSTILPGVTRSSIIEIAATEYGCTVEERPRFLLEDIALADEAFCVGTGASVTPIGSISVSDINDDNDDDDRNTLQSHGRIESSTTQTIVFGDGTTPGQMTQRLYETLLAIQTGTDEELNERYKDWIYIVNPMT